MSGLKSASGLRRLRMLRACRRPRSILNSRPRKRSCSPWPRSSCAGWRKLSTSRSGEGGGTEAHRRLLSQVIDMAVARRRAVGTLLSDPVLVRYLTEQELYQRLMARLLAALFGYGVDDKSRVRAAVLATAVSAVSNHFVVDVYDDTLRENYLRSWCPYALLPAAT